MAGNASATFGLAISEKWIRQRLNLQKDSLDDVRSLSLPGSYCEKVTLLGRSLLGFTRLKHLDLSRNALESLEGLDHLSCLETLNLYYNNISSLKELFRLSYNTKLKDLDLRLNPVAKNEPDYRLFVVHMLVYLRRLDDRGVRDKERKAALMHFDTDQAYMFDKHLHRNNGKSERKCISPQTRVSARVELVKLLAPRHNALEDDTDQLLDLIAKSDKMTAPPYQRHLHSQSPSPSPPPCTTGSPLTRSSPPHLHHHHHDNHIHSTSASHPHFQPRVRRGRSPNNHKYPLEPQEGRELNLSDGIRESHCQEVCAYRDVRVKGNFTPAPIIRQSVETRNPSTSSHHALKQLLSLLQEHVEGDLMVLVQDQALQDDFNHWYKGHVQLTKGECVSPPARTRQVECLQREMEALQSELSRLEEQLREKDKSLKARATRVGKLEEMSSHHNAEVLGLTCQLEAEVSKVEKAGRKEAAMEEAHLTLQHDRKEMLSLQKKVHAMQEENKSLRLSLDHAPSQVQVEELQRLIGELQAEKRLVHGELEAVLDRHKQELINTTQLQQLTTMLQESHRSLVATNDHLLQELEEAKQRHLLEISQMNTNYQQLRKTVQLCH